MASLQEILDDKNNYPDDRKITLADGSETTLGELRGGFMKDSDYRRKTSEVAAERRRLEKERTEFLAARQEAELQLEQMAAKLVNQPQSTITTRTELDDELENNPVAKALMGKINDLNAQINKANEFIKGAETRFKQHETAFVASQHQQVLDRIMAFDPSLNKDELFDFCKTNNIPNLVNGYRLMTEDRRMQEAINKAKEEGRQAGIDEGKKSVSQVRVPSRRAVMAPNVTDNAPKTFDEAAEAALNDPEIQGMLEGPSLGF